jgi:hypothetical protein
MSGHVFIFQGNLAALACDAWLLPTDSRLNVVTSWLNDLPDADIKASIVAECLVPWEETVRAKPARVLSGKPIPILVKMGRAKAPWEWYLDGVDAFVECAVKLLDNVKPLQGRFCHLLALPLVGTRGGGAQDVKGHIAKGLLPRLQAAAEHHKVDLALVVFDARALAATQAARQDSLKAAKKKLSQHQRSALKKLSGRARQGSLALFMGAGIGQGAGLPGWNDLLRDLGHKVGLTEKELKSLKELDHLDRASFLARRCERDQKDLRDLVAELIQERSQHHSLTHGLLASLPVQAMVTQNYDGLMELASRGAKRELAVLPYEACEEAGKRWLLKMHGCVQHPKDIVLRREDFLRYPTRGALRGIVQTLLITQTMLFVGFSLVDPNFHQIADDIRQAVRGSDNQRASNPFGFALFLQPNPVLQELWQGELELLHMGSRRVKRAEAARNLDIFLDLLLAECTANTAHLLDASFDELLTPGEKEVGRELLQLQQRLGPEAQATEAWKRVQDLLMEFGLKEPAAGKF